MLSLGTNVQAIH